MPVSTGIFCLGCVNRVTREYSIPCTACGGKFYCLRRESGRSCSRCFWQNNGCHWDPKKVPVDEIPDGKGEWRLVRKSDGFPQVSGGTWGVVNGREGTGSGSGSGKRKAEAEELEVEPGRQVKKVKGKGKGKEPERENQETALGRRDNMVSKNFFEV